ncbi:MAG: adenylate/guanylate cyclase domain-containing protein [Saprospiraceae bacterium]|jgi:adenylate cyclase|nr:adenylate/guanylate cyclase domain-containing protein [Saprospiraceae bacterium]
MNYFTKIGEKWKSILVMQSEIDKFDILRPWTIISKSDTSIIYLSIIIFALFTFWENGLSWYSFFTSLCASIPAGVIIAFFETQTTEFRRRHGRNSFAMFLIYKIIRIIAWFFLIFLLIGLIAHSLNINIEETIYGIERKEFTKLTRVLKFLILVTSLTITSYFVGELNRKLGSDALKNLILGKYHKSIEEERIFLFIDVNDSTTHAENLGEHQFSKLLQDIFYDLGEPILKYNCEIYQYVGDEVVVSWLSNSKNLNRECYLCFFAVERQLLRYKSQYIAKYGFLPQLKASLHGGTVITSEVGKYKAEIAHHGDVLNTCSRMLQYSKEQKVNYVCSQWMLDHFTPPSFIDCQDIGEFQFKGKVNLIKIYSLVLGKLPEKKQKK